MSVRSLSPLSAITSHEHSVFRFGVEIEAVVEPHLVRPEWRDSPQKYFEILVTALRNRNLMAVTDAGTYCVTHPEHYDKWLITKDGSLRGRSNQVCLEAISPVMKTTDPWEREFILFWEAMRKVFRIQTNFTCGSHVHITPSNRLYSLNELKIIAFAIITQEQLVHAFLPVQRRENNYCKRNSKVSPLLIDAFKHGKRKSVFKALGNRVISMTNNMQILELIQGTHPGARYVIWNFWNIVRGGSGTIEFRGGRHLRGPNRTLWWLTFAVSFISLALTENRLRDNSSVYVVPNDPPSGAYKLAVSHLWERIKSEADRLDMGGYLPESWQTMQELSS